jgi:hypothetical protein
MANLSNINNKFLVTTGGNVGIGTTSPASVLHIKDNSANPTQLSIQSNDYSRAEEINFLNPSTSAISGQIKYYTNPTVEYMSFSTSNNSAAAERMRITNTGNVGIGTVNPKTNFEVIGGLNISTNTTSATTTTMRIGSYGASSQTYYGAKLIAHTNFTSTANADLSFDLGGLGEVMRLHCNGSETRVGIGTTTPNEKLQLAGNLNAYAPGGIDAGLFASTAAGSTTIALRSSGVTHFNGGDVGIGTSSPGHKLNIVGANNTTAVGIDFPSASYDFSANSTSGYTTSFHMDNTGTYIGSNSAGRALIFQTNDTDRLYINGNTGNVGIGVTDPQAKLEVKGPSASPADGNEVISVTNTTGGSKLLLGVAENQYGWIQSAEGGTYRNLLLNPLGGNVGIGVVGPTSILDIRQSIVPRITLVKNGVLSWYIGNVLQGTSNNFTIGTDSGGNNNILNITNTGNVGIGEASPSGALHVKSSTATTTGMVRLQNDMDNNYETLRIESLGNYDAHIGFLANGTSDYWWGIGIDYSDSGKFKISGDNILSVNTRLTIDTSGNVGIGTTSPGDAKLYVNGGTTLGGTNNNSAGAIRMFGDRKLPQANNFVRRNYNLTAGSSSSLYSIARQWHDHANWGLGNINVIMWGIYYGQGQYNKADFSCRYGYSGGGADVQTNFNPNGMVVPSWTSATQVSGNIHYRDLQIQIPAYYQISFEIISPGCVQTYNINNTANNTVYLYPH